MQTPVERDEGWRLTRRNELVRAVSDQYTRPGLLFFPENYAFPRPVLIPTAAVLSKYPAVLLLAEFDFLLCDSALSGATDLARQLASRLEGQSAARLHFFKDLCVEETAGRDVTVVAEYHRHAFPTATFEVLSEESIARLLKGHPNVLLSTAPLPAVESLAQSPPFPPHGWPASEDCVAAEIAEAPPKGEGQAKAGPSENPALILKGTVAASSVEEGVAEILGGAQRIRLEGPALNRAMHGDEVLVAHGQVAAVLKQKQRVVVGTVIATLPVSSEACVAIIRPIDRRLPDVCAIADLHSLENFKDLENLKSLENFKDLENLKSLKDEPSQAHEMANQNPKKTEDSEPPLCDLKNYKDFEKPKKYLKVAVLITDWPANQRLPRGTLFRILGQSGNMETEILSILEHFGVDHHATTWESLFGAELPRMAAAAVETARAAVEEAAAGTREDLRSLCVCSIDPPGCTDIDDALHCTDRGSHLEVGVHIADVSFFVSEDSPLCAVARERSTTVYLPGRRIDMLPPFLSSEQCSLRAGEDRACFSCVWEVHGDLRTGEDLRVTAPRIFRSLIRSQAALTYEEAHAIAEDSARADPLAVSLRWLQRIADVLRAQRFARGALELNSRAEGVPTHHLVEEFMLLANTTVAEFMHRYCPEYSLLRKHPLPTAVDIDGVDCSSSAAINASLAGRPAGEAQLLKRVITRSMQQALYFVSGETADFFHYGLAAPIYTHFTSPIRRYPDLVVHRILGRVIDGWLKRGDAEAVDALEEVVTGRACAVMNYRHRCAQGVSRMVDELRVCARLEEEGLREGVEGLREEGVVEVEEEGVEGRVVAMRAGGCVVYLPQWDCEGFLEETRERRLFEAVRVRVAGGFARYCVDRVIRLRAVGEACPAGVNA